MQARPIDERRRLDDVSDRYSAAGGFEGLMVQESARRLALLASGRALEIGPGEGFVTRELAKRCTRVTVVEAAARYAAAVRALAFPNVAVVESLAEEYETVERFDTIVLSHILEHVEDPIGLLSKARALLASGGHVLVVVPNARSLHRRIGNAIDMLAETDALSDSDVALGHRRVYDEATLVAHLDDAGLAVETALGHFVKPLSNAQMDALPIPVQRAFLVVDDAVDRRLAAEIVVTCAPRVA